MWQYIYDYMDTLLSSQSISDVMMFPADKWGPTFIRLTVLYTPPNINWNGDSITKHFVNFTSPIT